MAPSAASPVARPEPARREDASSYVTIRLGASEAADVRFLIDRSQRRSAGAVAASVATHVVLVAVVLFVLRLAPPRAFTQSTILPDMTPDRIVWLAQEGPGGGGGGGGNQSPEPPRKVELPGRDKITLPATRPPVLDQPKPREPEPPPIETVNIPALAMASGVAPIPGTLEGTAPPESTSQGSGSGGGAGTGRGTGIGPGEGSGLGPGSGGGTGGGVYRPGSGIVLPRPIREVKPQYTADAMRAKIQGQVLLEAVVLPDGSVGDVEVVRSLDPVFGLDQEAIKAAKQWRFVPGTRQGQPVAVLVTIEMTFTLR
jgi:TonB family protein